MNTAILHPGEKKAQYLWTAFILMFFLIQATIWTVAISITSGDRSHTVVAGYDEQALRWDDVKAMQQASKTLGWNCQLSIAPEAGPLGNRIAIIQLSDRDGVALSGVNVQCDAYHRGSAADVQSLKFVETDPGVYGASIQIDKAGRWRFSGSAVQDENRFLIEQEVVTGVSNATINATVLEN